MNLKQQLVRTAVAWGVLLAFLGGLNPGKLPVVALIVPFVLVYLALYGTWRLIGLLRARFFSKDPVDPTEQGSGEQQSRRKPHRHLGMAICGSLVLLLVLQSLGQLSVRDVVTLLAIVLLGYLYVTRSRFVPGKL